MYEDLTFCFDIDGTLCPIKKKEEAYIDLVPYPEMIDKIREYKAGGAKIVLFTSRTKTKKSNRILYMTKPLKEELLAWLEKWDIPYDEIVYGKPWPGHKGFYVDDRTIRPDEFLRCSVDEMDEICKKSRPQNQ